MLVWVRYNTDITPVLEAAPSVTIAAPERRRERVAAPRQREYLPALTGLRFWLAIWVILHHICGKGMMLETWVNTTLPDFAVRIIHGGYLAVQTFFVLSGFVLARTYAQARWDRRSLGRFFTARFARIYPVYLVSLIVVSPFIIEMLRRPSFSWLQRGQLLTDYLLVLQGWRGSLGVGWNTPAWSLSCEFFFYLWFPVLFVLLRNARWRSIAVALAGAILLPRALDHAGVPWDWKPVYDLGDFVAGIAAARIFALTEMRWRGRGYWFYIPAALAGAWLIANPRLASETTGDLAMYLRPLNAIALVGFALGGGIVARAMSVRVFDFLGKASYSMYVLHVPILWWLGRYLVHGTALHLSRPLGASIYLTVVMVASGCVYQWLEHPGSEWIRSWQKRSPILGEHR